MSTDLALRGVTEVERQPAGLELLAQLERAGAITATSLTLTDPDLPFEQFEALLTLFGRVKRTCSWLLGDALNFGEGVYGERYAQAVESTGLRRETLMNYASVCRYVARSRRRDSLSFGHHSAVTSLEPDEQTRWLDACEANGWSRTELRDRLKEANAVEPPEQPSWSRVEPDGGTPPPMPSEPLSQPPSAPSGDPRAGAPLPPAPEGELGLAAAVRSLIETAVLLEGGFEPVHEDNLVGGMQPKLVGISLGEDHYIVPRVAFEAVAALVGEE